MKKQSKDIDYVSACCKADYKRRPFEGGSHPICKKCKKGCSLELPAKEIEKDITGVEIEEQYVS